MNKDTATASTDNDLTTDSDPCPACGSPIIELVHEEDDYRSWEREVCFTCRFDISARRAEDAEEARAEDLANRW